MADDFGERIKARRLEHRLTQLELARRCGTNEEAIAGFEEGQPVPDEMLREITRVLGVKF